MLIIILAQKVLNRFSYLFTAFSIEKILPSLAALYNKYNISFSTETKRIRVNGLGIRE